MAEPRVVAIIQARMSSTRLPGKTLIDLGDRSVLENVVARVRLAWCVSEVVVATTVEAVDDAIANECRRIGVHAFRGSRDDVLSRFLAAARDHRADVVVRVTADCPLLDAGVLDDVVRALLSSQADYASNTIVRTFPRGLDVEALRMDALETIAARATEAEDREHVTLFVHRHAGHFTRESVVTATDQSRHRWTLDTEADLRFMRAVYALAKITTTHVPPWIEVVRLLDQHPEVAALNAEVQQKVPSFPR